MWLRVAKGHTNDSCCTGTSTQVLLLLLLLG
jgi:hypothetical protein